LSRVSHTARLPPASATGPAGSLATPYIWSATGASGSGPVSTHGASPLVYRASDDRCLPPRTPAGGSSGRVAGHRAGRPGPGRADRVDDGTTDRTRCASRVHVVAGVDRRGSHRRVLDRDRRTVHVDRRRGTRPTRRPDVPARRHPRGGPT